MARLWVPIIGMLEPVEGDSWGVFVRSGPSRRVFKFASPEEAAVWHQRLVLRGWKTTTPVGWDPAAFEQRCRMAAWQVESVPHRGVLKERMQAEARRKLLLFGVDWPRVRYDAPCDPKAVAA